jgi:crotonobetainyl-CoA:carnitine CoA-transferase CaiB-like acyl-CoA transferase
MTEPPAAPYAGLTVLDLTQGLAGPYCASMFALQGARVIKIEPPRGDWVRFLGRGEQGLSALAIAGNLGKRAIAIDATRDDGRRLILRLCAQADVLLESFRPGVMRKLGLDYPAVSAANPALVYGSITGFGDGGPWAAKGGTDSVLQAYTGMAVANRDADGTPRRIGLLVPDTVTALYAAQCVAAGLFARAQTGRGRHVAVSLAECCAAFQTAPIVDDALFGTDGRPPNNVPAGVFRTTDGYVILLALTDAMWTGVCGALDQPAWLTEPRYATLTLRQACADEINRLTAEQISTRSTQDWVDTCERFDVLCAEVLDYAAFRQHPQAVAMQYFGELQQAPYGTLGVPRLPGMDRACALPPAPRLAEHTTEVLTEFGLSAAEIAALEGAGTILQGSH